MITFGSAITKPDVYRRFAEVGILRAAEPDSKVIALPSIGSIFTSYNAILDQAAAFADLEALVLVHQDAEIVDPRPRPRARRPVVRSGRRRDRMRGRDRCPKHCLVGGFGDARLVRPPLRLTTAAATPRFLVGLG